MKHFASLGLTEAAWRNSSVFEVCINILHIPIIYRKYSRILLLRTCFFIDEIKEISIFSCILSFFGENAFFMQFMQNPVDLTVYLC